jgi:hypothetical protein
MQGTALSLHVTSSPNDDDAYTGATVPPFVAALSAHTPPAARLTKWIDASGVLSPDGKEVRVAIVNRHQTKDFSVPIEFGPAANVASNVTVHQVTQLNMRFSLIMSSVLTAVSVRTVGVERRPARPERVRRGDGEERGKHAGRLAGHVRGQGAFVPRYAGVRSSIPLVVLDLIGLVADCVYV